MARSNRRATILAAARRVIARHGLKGATKEKLAAEAGGVSPALVFWHFGSKANLFREVARQATPLAAIEGLWPEVGELPLPTALERLLAAYLAAYRDPVDRRLFFQVLLAAGERPEIRGLLQDEVEGVVQGRLLELLQRAESRGELRAGLDLPVLAEALLGTVLIFICLQEALGELPWEEDRILAAVGGFVRSGLEAVGP